MILGRALLRVVVLHLFIGLTHESSDNATGSYPELVQTFGKREKVEPLTKKEDVPPFLLDLYRRRTLLSRGRPNQKKSETVRVFFRQPFEQGEPRGPLHRRLFFNLSAISVEEKVTKAELRIFKKNPKSLNPHGYFKIRILRLKKQRTQYNQLHDSGIIVTSQVVKNEQRSSRWLSFNITATVRVWRARPLENFGLVLSVKGLKTFPVDFHIAGQGRRAPFLVTYTTTAKESRDSSKDSHECDDDRQDESDPLQNVSMMAQRRVKRSYYNRCQRRWYYVQFKKLRWNWIIAPRGYSANYCTGPCPKVLDRHLEPTNHAILQNILHRMDERIPSPSCVPTKLRAISVLYRTSDKSITLTEYTGMVVSTCGCR